MILVSPGASHMPRIKSIQEGFRANGYENRSMTGMGSIDLMRRSLDGCSVAICSGTRAQSALSRKLCAEAGIPVVVVDLGYLHRSSSYKDLTGYNQAGWNKIGWVPEGPLLSDRFDRLNLKVDKERAPGYSPDTALVIGQVAGDGQHGMDAQALSAWLGNFTDRVVASRPHLRQVIFRPHPLARDATLAPSVPCFFQDPRRDFLGPALAAANCVITFNSTTGVEALMRAVPVVCARSAHFHAVAEGSYEERLEYCHRLAYAQWTQEELRSGEAVSFLLSRKPT